jgi:signal transduction histidine kinase
VSESGTATALIDRLVAHRTLGAAPREELAWLVAHGTLQHLQPGAVVSSKESPVSSLLILLTGHVAIYLDRGAGRRKVMEWRTGDVMGVLPYSRMITPPGEGIVHEASEVLAIPRSDLTAMIRECHEVTSILVHKMLDRARVFTSSGLQDEKMLSLGKLSAGLAHELNNPAAAIERAASLLDERLDDAEHAARVLGGARLTDRELAAIDSVRSSCLAWKAANPLSPIQQAEREDAIAEWLEAHGVEATVAAPLAETAVTLPALDQIAAVVTGAHLGAALRWVAAGCSLRGLASDIQEAATRISGLVAAVKGFTHMDQAAVAEPVDVQRSLVTTVTVLNAKARANQVTVTVNVDTDLPRARGYVGELNQIWANLIDNALDAAGQAGRVDVVARPERGRVVVRVIDNGPGVPEEYRSRVFEPFFTTKPVGKGTGLGLDIVRRLVTHNDAEIELDSVPGRTEFRVSLPLADAPRPESPR